MNKKLIFVLLLLFVTIISVSAASAFWPFDSGDLVDVTEVIYETGINYGDTPFGYATGNIDNNAKNFHSVVAFKIMPKETISGVNSIKLNNFKITYDSGKTDEVGTITFNNNKNTYTKGNEYAFSYKYYIDDDIKGQKVHISGDIVMDTLNEQNKVIGHLDYDTPVKAWSATY